MSMAVEGDVQKKRCELATLFRPDALGMFRMPDLGE